MLGAFLSATPSWGENLDCIHILSAKTTLEQSQAVLRALAFGIPQIHVSDRPANDADLLQLALRTQHDFGTHTLTISSLREHRGRWNDSGVEAFKRLAKRDVAFVTGIYEARRQNWPASFITKLRGMQTEYLDLSTYIDQEIDGQMVASVRLIRDKYGRLPMEEYLGLKFKVPLGTIKIEPGNYAIKKELTELGSIATSIGMLAETSFLSKGAINPFFATYADRYSEMLYGQMGFRFVTPEMIENWPELAPQATVDPKTGAIRISKTEYDPDRNTQTLTWTPMYATHEMFVAMLEERLTRIAQKRGGTAMSSAIQHLRESVESALKSPAHEFVGPLANGGQLGRMEIAELGTGMAEISVFGPSVDGWGQELREHVRVPWPLPRRIEEDLVGENGIGHISFYGGKMLVTRVKPVSSITKIQFHVDYTVPEHLSYERKKVGRTAERFAINFGFQLAPANSL